MDEIRVFPVKTYIPSKAHINIIPSDKTVDADTLNKLWGMLGAQTDGFSFKHTQSTFENNLTGRYSSAQVQSEFDSDPELFERQVLQCSFLYMCCMFKSIDTSRLLGNSTAEITVPFYDYESAVVLAGLDLAVAALTILKYKPRRSKGLMQHSYNEALKHINPPNFQQIKVSLTDPTVTESL
jgi:hypothetical protein